MFKLNNDGYTVAKIGTNECHIVASSGEYLAWLAEGNTPEPADPPAAPTYQELRAAKYAPIQEQLDMQYHDSITGTTLWLDHVMAVKAQFPKESV